MSKNLWDLLSLLLYNKNKIYVRKINQTFKNTNLQRESKIFQNSSMWSIVYLILP